MAGFFYLIVFVTLCHFLIVLHFPIVKRSLTIVRRAILEKHLGVVIVNSAAVVVIQAGYTLVFTIF